MDEPVDPPEYHHDDAIDPIMRAHVADMHALAEATDPRVASGLVIQPADDGLVRVVPPAGWPPFKIGQSLVLRGDGLTVTYVVVGADNGALLLRAVG